MLLCSKTETHFLMPTKLDSVNFWKMFIWKIEEMEEQQQDVSGKDRLLGLEVNETDSDFDTLK